MRNLAAVLQIVGMVALVIGVGLTLGVGAGLVVAALALLVTGVVLEREQA